ncbi:hypothetical protein HDU91_004015 [Kappamyces sp. JEL0680]|nr:hypothetical protein HDU91_004015 [Kappamyces sp. JEL0680]
MQSVKSNDTGGLVNEETAQYIDYLMKGTGASINFDELRNELSKTSSVGGILDQPPSPIKERGAPASNLDAFRSFVKVSDLEYTPAKTSGRSQGLLSALTADVKTTGHGSYQNLTQKDTLAQLERLSRQLVKDGFSPLHPSLLVTTSGDNHVAGTLTETQALYLISTLSVLITEFENRGNTIQHLVQQVSSVSPQSKSGDKQESNTPNEARVAELQQQVQSLKQELSSKAAALEKMQMEERARYLRDESTRNRNRSMLEAIKQKYYYDTPGLEPVLHTIIEAYEEKLSQRPVQPPTTVNHFQDLSEGATEPDMNSETATPVKNLAMEITVLKKELQATQQERDVLSLKLINETKAYRDSNIVGTPDTELSTRERIQRDKKLWKKGTTPKPKSFQAAVSDDSSKAILKDVCGKLGITDYEHIGPCVEKIQLVIRLIPQMEQFIREVNATIHAYNTGEDTSMNSSGPVKLAQSLAVIRQWASIVASSKDQLRFVADVHEKLRVTQSPGSVELCIVELERLVAATTTPGAVSLESSQQAVSHLMGLFNIPNVGQVIPRMNELYVFWAEVNDGM